MSQVPSTSPGRSRRLRRATEPRPLGAEKLSGLEKFRIHQGDYRILSLIDDREASVVIIKIGHRSDVYRQAGCAIGRVVGEVHEGQQLRKGACLCR